MRLTAFLRLAFEQAPVNENYLASFAQALLTAGNRQQVLDILAAARDSGIDSPQLRVLDDLASPRLPTPREPLNQKEQGALVAMFRAERFAELEKRTRRLTRIHPNSGVAWKALSLSLVRQGKLDLDAFRTAARLLPDDAQASYYLACALRDGGIDQEATAHFRRAVALKPNDVDALFALGENLNRCGDLEQALSAYRRVLELDPNSVEALNNLGNIMKAAGELTEALIYFRRALDINPQLALLHGNIGSTLLEQGFIFEAAASCQLCLDIDPGFVAAHSNLLFAQNYLCNRSAGELAVEASRFGDAVVRQAQTFTTWSTRLEGDRILRVGLVSGDLREHPVGFFLERMLMELVERAPRRVEIYAYFNNSKIDAVSTRLKDCCTVWRNVENLPDEKLAWQIRDDNIDVLIDLSGHTARNRLGVFAWKPAPVQATWLGYFATTGVTAVDYLIADPWTVPVDDEAHFVERIVRLPETYICFTPPDVKLDVGPLPALSSGIITFGNFNQLAKMNDDVVALWSRVLKNVPTGRLFLKTRQLNDEKTRRAVVERFAAQGIDSARLIVEGSAPRKDLLASYSMVDIALDPFPYPGGTTSIESLWMGVPVLSLKGDRFLSRIGESILQNAGLSDWIAADPDDFVDRAVRHAADIDGLSGLRNGLREQVLASPLFDAKRFAKHFEDLLLSMWNQRLEQEVIS